MYAVVFLRAPSMLGGTCSGEPPWEETSMQNPDALTAQTLVGLPSAAGAARFPRLLAGSLTVVLCIAFWGAWMLLIGIRPCVTASLLWR